MSKSSAYIDFAAVKAAVSLQQILDHYSLMPTLSRSGSESLRGCCPIHKGTSPDQFCVTLSKNAWKCFSECQHGGNQIDFVMRMENCSLHEAARKMSDWFKLGLEKNVTERPRKSNDGDPGQKRTPKPEAPAHTSKPVDEHAHPPVDSPGPAESVPEESGVNKPLAFALQHLDSNHAYLTDRGLTEGTITEFGLGYCPKGIMAGRIVIPIHNPTGELVAYAGRWPGVPPEGKEKYRLPGGFKKTLELYNIHRALKESGEEPMVIVEGYFDVMRLWQNGIRRVVAIMGTHLSDAQEQLIRSDLRDDDRILIALDDDDAGRKAVPAILARLAPYAFVRIAPSDWSTESGTA